MSAHAMSMARLAGVLASPDDKCPSCGWPEGSFACRIRHQHLNTGDAKAAND